MTGAGAATRIAVEDRLDLLELHAALARAIDTGDADGWARLFSADGLLRTSRGTEVRGRAELAAFAADWFERNSGRCRHVTWHHRFDGGGHRDEAIGTCYAAVLRQGGDGVAIDFTSFYRDRFQRGLDGWLLRERQVAIDSSNDRGG